MLTIKHLMQYKSVLDDAKPSFSLFSFMQPTVKGEFRGYAAEYGIRQEGSISYLFFRIRLKERVRVPLLLWDSCPIESSAGIDLCFGKWLTISKPVCSDLKRMINSLGETTVRNHFDRLMDSARKLENGESAIGKRAFAQQKQLMIGILSVVSACMLIYWLFVYVIQ